MKSNEEQTAKIQARVAKKQAQADERARIKTEKSIERIRQYEKDAQDAEAKSREERKRRSQISGSRKEEIEERSLSAEEKRDREIERLHNFYDAKLDKDGNIAVTINPLRMIDCLRALGFYRYDQPGGLYEYVHVHNGKIRLIGSSNEQIQAIVDAFEDYIMTLPNRTILFDLGKDDNLIQVEKEIYPDLLLEKLYRGITNYFSQTLPRLRPRKDTPVQSISTVHDTKQAKYLFYNNTVVRITAEGTETIDYSDIHDKMAEYGEDNGYYIWDTSIIDREFSFTPKEIGGGEFEDLCWYISGRDSELKESQVKDRMQSLMSILGYMMHDNYECNNKLALFIDAKIEDGMSSGGTGKGIIGKALRAMTNRVNTDTKYISVPGKGLDTKKDTRYSAGDITTQIIHIEDADRYINFEDLYPDVTEGATFRKLHHDPTHHFCKIMISTNCPFNINAESTKRRLVLFELSPYFSSKRTPEQVFGRRLFERDWSVADWAMFDNFMIRCIELYMSKGLIEKGELNYVENYLQAELGSDVYHWFNDTTFAGAMRHEVQSCYVIEDLWTMFTKKYPDKFNKRNSFTKAIKLFLRTKKIPSGIVRRAEDMVVLYPLKETNISDVIYADN